MKHLLFILAFCFVSLTLAQSDNVISNIYNDGYQEPGLTIYPMPVTGDAFRISGINTLEIQSLEVYDMTGRLVGKAEREQIAENGEISVEHLNRGTYVIWVIFNEQKITRKIILE